MKICIDPGHGLPDVGSLGSHSREADINMSISLKLKSFLEEYGISVVMTHENTASVNTKPIDLHYRVNIANESNSDYFLSIHCNYSNKDERGTVTYFNPANKKNEKFAKAIQSTIVEYAKSNDRSTKAANFYVLRNINMPGAIVQLLYISNPAEESMLINQNWQENLAKEMAQCICEITNFTN